MWECEIWAGSEATLLRGCNLLSTQSFAQRVRIAGGHVLDDEAVRGLAIVITDDQMVVLLDPSAVSAVIGAAGVASSMRCSLELTTVGGTIRMPSKRAQQFFDIDLASVTDAEERWIRHAVHFVLEAADPRTRSLRVSALRAGLEGLK